VYVGAADLVHLNLDHSLPLDIGKTVPFTGGTDAENDISPISVLDHMANDPALLRRNYPPLGIDHRDYWDAQSPSRRVVHKGSKTGAREQLRRTTRSVLDASMYVRHRSGSRIAPRPVPFRPAARA